MWRPSANGATILFRASSLSGSPTTLGLAPEMAAEAIVVSRDGDSPAYDIDQLRQDLERFVFLLDGSEGEPLFGA
jgi:hypothetical protein